MVLSGSVSAEVQANAPASAVWEIYGTLKLPQYGALALPDVIDRTEVVQGDGSAGTVVEIFYIPGATPFSSYKEQYMIVDNEKRVKVGDTIEGAYLDFGFTFYRLRYEIIEKDEKSCIIKATVEYDIKDEFADNVSLVTTDLYVAVMKYVANSLTTKAN